MGIRSGYRATSDPGPTGRYESEVPPVASIGVLGDTSEEQAASAADRPDVAVVVPTRNRARLLDRLLAQLVTLDGPHRYEIVVVDEGSDDGTPELLADYVARHGITVVRHDTPRGLSGARNAGFERSTAAYVAWIDDDDLTAPDRLVRQFTALRDGTERWSCAGRVDIDDSLEVIGHVRCPMSVPLLPVLLRSNVLPSAGQGLLVERELATTVGPYDERLASAEDWDYAIRLAATGDGHMLDEPLVGYRTGFESMSTDTARMETAIRAVTEKHATLYSASGAAPDWSVIHQSLLPGDLRAGRLPALRRSARSFMARPSLSAARRCLLVAVAPRWFGRRSARRRREQVPVTWIDQAERWLDPLRTTTTVTGADR